MALIFILIFAVTASAQAPISGYINGTLEDTTYSVEGYIYVAEGDSLIIEPGAVLLFNGDYQFIIYGYLYAAGTNSDSIIFQCADGVELWGTIVFNDNCDDNSVLSYCYITGCRLGGINCYYCDITISYCTITGNFASWGGGIYINTANPQIMHCVIYDNWCVCNGGGIYCTHSSPTISDCIIYNNSCNIGGSGSGQGGGGICANHGSNPTILNCTIYDNLTNDKGGGIAINDNSVVTMIECEIYDNWALHEGGGIYICYTEATISRCTISGNTTPNFGGGISMGWQANPTIINSIIESNNGDGGIYIDTSTTPSISYCDIFGNEGGNIIGDSLEPGLGEVTIVNANGDSCDIFHNIFLDPLFYDPTAGNFQLQEDSPCIDAGDPASGFDPDGTTADLGAHFYPQGAQPQLIYDLTISISDSSVLLIWGSIPDAFIYHIYRSETPYFETSGIQPIAYNNSPFFEDDNAVLEGLYFYRVTWE
ncbi:MAG: right-handed parallel beta-helix repeat-containing protein [candidate division Zixibacteria bacterium]|nr:right-handed parallel beta-helix repeat-containing protein [Candidatus Tariuqbacter arcticus]